MESPRYHRGALVKRTVKTRRAVRTLLVVLLTAPAAIGLSGGTATQASTQTFSVTDLGTLGSTTVAYGINANAQIVGRGYLLQTVPGSHCPPRHPSCRVSVFHAFRYGAGRITDLGTLGGTYSDARAINSNGDVAGFSTLSGTDVFAPTDAFLYSNGNMKDLGTLGGSSSHAYGINGFGEVVGDSYTASSQDDAFLYTGGHMTDLGTLGGSLSSANGINNSHQVVGSSETSNTFSSAMHAFLWSSGRMKDLGTLGGDTSIAYAINNVGQVVGYASPPNSSVHAFLYSSGKMTDLGVLFDSSVGEAMNNFGVVVGTSSSRAFIYSGGKMQDLNTLIPPNSGTMFEATGINDKGQIVCNGTNASGYGGHAFLLTPRS
jgi:probable HAF family extracellular repeat protein